jgi:diamine N-acetyltransferase
MPEIRPVTIANWEEIIELRVREDQKHFVASNLYSIAEAQFGFDFEGHWDLHPNGIYEGANPVGFLMYALNQNHPRFQAFIIRLMVDERYQGRGYGRFGINKMLEIFRGQGHIGQVGISYEPENQTARSLYASFGFVEPGEMLDDEVLALLKLR